jgi:hypothetical protein
MLGFILWRWWESAMGQVTPLAATLAVRDRLPLMATIFVVARCGAYLVEGAFYVTWWRWRGERLPYWRFVSWLMVLWFADLAAAALGGIASRHPDVAPWLAPFAGLRWFRPDHHAAAGLAAAFDDLGLPTIARLVGTAWVQARSLGRPLREPLVLTASAWTFTRLFVGFGLDLARGVSPMP